MDVKARKYRRRGYRKPRKYSKPVKKAIRRVRNTAFKKKVLSVIRSQAETKEAFHEQPTTDFNSGISGTGDVLKIVPNIVQGVANNERIGEQIRVTSIQVRGILQMLPQNIGQGDSLRKIACRVMIVTPKSYGNWSSAPGNQANWLPTLLRKGGTTKPFEGLTSDLFLPVNTDAITCHYNKVFYFNQSTYGTSTSSGYVEFSQDKLVRFLNIKLKCRNKLVKYDEDIDSGNTPANLGYFMLVGYCFVDGTSPDLISTRIRLQYDSFMKYEDA